MSEKYKRDATWQKRLDTALDDMRINGPQRAMRTFMIDIEAHLAWRENKEAKDIVDSARRLVTSFGGTPVEHMPFQKNPVLLAMLPGALAPDSVYFYGTDPDRPFQPFMQKEYPLADILAQAPEHPSFWENQARDGKVSYSAFSQYDERDEANTNIPNGLISLDPDEEKLKVLFFRSTSTIIQWPLAYSKGLYQFADIPVVLDRAFRVYLNACETRGIRVFSDKDPSHASYKGIYEQAPPIAIEFDLENPLHGRPMAFGR